MKEREGKEGKKEGRVAGWKKERMKESGLGRDIGNIHYCTSNTLIGEFTFRFRCESFVHKKEKRVTDKQGRGLRQS